MAFRLEEAAEGGLWNSVGGVFGPRAGNDLGGPDGLRRWVLAGGPIPEEIITEVLSRCNIVDVVGEYLQLRKVGNGYQALCPFHSDAKPSFYVSESKGFFHCFGCGAGGNVFHFLMRARGMSFPEAVRAVASRVGVGVPEKELSQEEKELRRERNLLLDVNKEAASFFRAQLLGSQGGKARAYLEQRGISSQTQELFALGWAPVGWRGLLEHLKPKGEQFIKKAHALGLLVEAKDGSFYDRFRGRIVFPIQEEDGSVVGFGARALGSEEPKYLNSPESPLFSKGRCLYGLQMARPVIRQRDEAILVEGYMDLLAIYQAGIRNAVATLGTSLTREHLMRLRRYSANLICVFDGDEAGERATMRAVDLCLDMGVWGKVLRLPQDEDPDSYVKKKGKEGFLRALDGAVSLMDFLVTKTQARYSGKGIEGKKKALEELIPRLRRLKDPILRDHYIAFVANALGVSELRVEELLREDGGIGARKTVEPTSSWEKFPTSEKLLVQCLLSDPSLAKGLDQVILKEMQNDQLRELARLIWERVERKGVPADPSELFSCLESSQAGELLAQLISGLEEVGENPQRVCQDCLKDLRRRSLDRQIKDLAGMISRARQSSDSHKLTELEGRRARLVLEKKRLGLPA